MDNVWYVILAAIGGVCLLLLMILVLRKNRGTGAGDVSDQLRALEKQNEALSGLAQFNARSIENLNRATETRLNNIQARLAEDIKYMAEANAHNLDVIRRSVDERLSSSLDGRLSESYARISDRLERMYESVGEMKTLSSSVADIRRVFSNVKLRGTWGESQLESLLAQMLSPEQYAKSVKVNPKENTFADFAVILPSKDGKVYLPIDSKFPLEEFERLCECSERLDREGEERARKNLERALKIQAESIAKKYIAPPETTDFALMYLPSEALYAEAMRMPGLADFLRARKVTAAGPTNVSALLATLQTGFRTAAIEKRSGELYRMLEEFRRDFQKFSEDLERTRRKLQEAQDAVDGTAKKGAVIGRRLESFGALGAPEQRETQDLPDRGENS